MAERFTATSWERRPEDGALVLAYECSRYGRFVETLALPGAAAEAPWDAAARGLASLLHAALGVSYYKAAAAPEIVLETLGPSPAASALVRALYREGLGEFFVRNGLPYPPEQRVIFKAEFASPRIEPAAAVDPTNGAVHVVLAFGGGKDSHVALDIVEQAGWSAELACVALSDRIGRAIAGMTDRPLTIIRRTLDPALLAANRAGALNGHVPVTAINSLALVLYAHLTGARRVVFANERSADEATLDVGGHAVNHQYSKTLAAERLVREAVQETGSAVDYFSVLRPVSELWIARRLAGLPHALAQFRSCNRNFVQAEADAPQRAWCGACAKCAFTALVTAPFLPRARSVALFGGDVLDTEAAVEHLAATAGLGDVRPWDCVGGVEETAAALHRLSRDPEWASARAVRTLAPRVEAAYGAARLAEIWEAALRPEGEHHVPTEISLLAPHGERANAGALEIDAILVFGAGREAEACLAHLAESGGPPTVLMDDDPARARALAARFPALARAAHDLSEAESLLQGRALLLRAPSVKLDHPAVAWSEARGVPYTTFTGWWLARSRDRVAATVTGTKGKSTTTVLLAQILAEAGAPTRAAGNLGVPPKADPSRPDERFVLEMSSYQLSDAPAAAPVHVITNIHREHLDWHGGFEPYWRAKRRPLELSADCVGVLHRADAWLLDGLPNRAVLVEEIVEIGADRLVARWNGARFEAQLPQGAELDGVRGANLATALAAALATGRAAPEALCAAAARVALSFPGLPSRQAVLGNFADRLWVDDALATIPEATLAALARWSGARVHLVIGGKDRGQDFAALADWLRAHPSTVVHAYGPTGERLLALLGLPSAGNRDFAATIADAFAASAPGDVILFSPAAATFEPGWSYETRSRIFQEAAASLSS